MTDQGLILLADIGGTNARFALMDGTVIRPMDVLKVAQHTGLAEAIKSFLAKAAPKADVAAAVLAVAGTVENDRCLITNSGWTVDAAKLQAALGFRSVHLLNDFEALAWSLPSLTAADLFTLQGGDRLPSAPMIVIGPGTGFGAACFIPRGRLSFAIAAEAGHSTLPSASEREDQVIAHLRQRFEHVSVERALSGPGLENLHQALSRAGDAASQRDAATITRAALDRTCPTSVAALDMFCGMLGTVAGNLALTFRARGGVYIGGGIAPRIREYLKSSDFRKRFESKGRYQAYLRDIPTSVIMRPDATFVGLREYFACLP